MSSGIKMMEENDSVEILKYVLYSMAGSIFVIMIVSIVIQKFDITQLMRENIELHNRLKELERNFKKLDNDVVNLSIKINKQSEAQRDILTRLNGHINWEHESDYRYKVLENTVLNIRNLLVDHVTTNINDMDYKDEAKRELLKTINDRGLYSIIHRPSD